MSDDKRSDGGATVDTAPGSKGGGNVVDWLLENKSRESVVALATVASVLLLPMFLIDILGLLGEIVGLELGGFPALATQILVFGTVAVGFNILLGYTGLLSFGHAAMFGTGAFGAALFSNAVSSSPVLVVLTAVLVGTLVSWPIGFLSIRRSGVYFAVLTLTFGQMLYFFAFGPGSGIIEAGGTIFTNGDDGYTPYTGFELTPELFGAIPLDQPVPILTPLLPGGGVSLKYLFVGAFAVLAVVFAHRIMKSPYGLILKALGENEQRVRFVGLNAARYKLMAFILSGAFAGLGGGLFAMYKAGLTVHPNQTLFWTVSGDFVIMTTLGGVGTLFGPLIGAGVFEYIRLVVSGIAVAGIEFAELWPLVLGLVFVLVVAFFSNGLYGGIRRGFRRVGNRLRAAPPEADAEADTEPRPARDGGGDD